MEMTKEDFDNALRILELTEQKMPYTFSGVGKSTTADVMQRVIGVLKVKKIINFSALMMQFYQDVDKLMLEKLVETLVLMKQVEVTYEGKERIVKYIGKTM
jgi:adenylate kinase